MVLYDWSDENKAYWFASEQRAYFLATIHSPKKKKKNQEETAG
jgi:hypothetical protein